MDTGWVAAVGISGGLNLLFVILLIVDRVADICNGRK